MNDSTRSLTLYSILICSVMIYYFIMSIRKNQIFARAYVQKSNELIQYVDAITELDWKEYLTTSHVYIEEVRIYINAEKQNHLPEQFWEGVLKKIDLISQINLLSKYILDLSSQMNRLLLEMAVINSIPKRRKRDERALIFRLDRLKRDASKIKLLTESIYSMALRMPDHLQRIDDIIDKIKNLTEVMDEISGYMDTDAVCICHHTEKVHEMIHLLGEILNQMDLCMEASRPCSLRENR